MEIPASLIQVSNPPKRVTAASATCRTSSSFPTSATTASACPPAALISDSSCRSAASLRAASTSRAPRCAAMRAVVKPIPLDAPVITMTCSSRGLRRILVMGDSFEAHDGSEDGSAERLKQWIVKHKDIKHKQARQLLVFLCLYLFTFWRPSHASP